MAKKLKKAGGRIQTFSDFLDEKHISAALVVFALIALFFATLEFTNSLR